MSFIEEIVSERLNRRQFVKVAGGATISTGAPSQRHSPLCASS
jgi:hypothetical protein